MTSVDYVDHVVAQLGFFGSSRDNAPHSIADAFPGAIFRDPQGRRPAWSDLTVVGSIKTVGNGQAFVLDGPTDSPVPWDRSDAETRTLIATMSVEQTLCSTIGTPKEVQFSFVFHRGDDADVLAHGLANMGRVVVFLKVPPGGTGPYDMAWDHSLFSHADAEGHLDYAAARDIRVASWFDAGDTVDEIQANCPA